MRATAKQLRARAVRLGEDIADLIATSNAIGEADGWQGARYEAVQRDIERYKAARAALIARAVKLEEAQAA